MTPDLAVADGPGVIDDEAGILRVPLERILDLANPLTGDPWDVGPMTLNDLADKGATAHMRDERTRLPRLPHRADPDPRRHRVA